MEPRVREQDGWVFVERGEPTARSRVLLLPGVFCSHRFYEPLVDDPALLAANVLSIAADPPGFAGRPSAAGFGYSVEEYARLVEEFIETHSIDLLVGHSYFANVAIEVASRGGYRGPTMLLSPCLRTSNEESDLRQLDRLGRLPLLGALAWLAVYPTLKGSMKGRLPADRLDELVSEMKRNPRAVNRQIITRYFDYLGTHEDLPARMARAAGSIWLVRGERDEIGFDAADRDRLSRAANVELKLIPGARHFSMLDAPAAVARLIVEQLTAVPQRAGGERTTTRA
jgi:pimeloyl-ACP methyl ester carboxylesterase